MRGLGGGVDDHIGPQFLDQLQDAGAVADIQLVVREAGQRRRKALRFQRVSPCGPKNTARWLLSTP